MYKLDMMKFFEEVQTGFSGADYIAYDRYMEDGENSIEMTGYTAGVRRTAKKRADGKKVEEHSWKKA